MFPGPLPGSPKFFISKLVFKTCRNRIAMNLLDVANRADDAGNDRLAIEKFAVGQSVPRREDPMLLRGLGRYTDDISLPGQAYAVMVRSRNAHGIIRGIDCKAASQMPGVLAVYTGADLKDYGPLKCIVALNNR